MTILQSPLSLPTLIQGGASPQMLRINSQYSQIGFEVNNASIIAITATGLSMQVPFVESVSGVTLVMGTRGSQSLVMRTNTLDRWAVDASGMLVPVASNVDIGTSAGPNPRNVYSSGTFFVFPSTRTLAASQNDYGIGDSGCLRVVTSGGASRTITGFAGGVDGRLLIVINVDATYQIILSDQSASSAAANRIITGFNADLPLNPNSGSRQSTVVLIYDGTSSRWRVISTNQQVG